MTGTPAPAEPHRTPEIDEVFRRIGRNLLLFQHIEHLLKQLMTSARLEGTLQSMRANFDERRARTHKQTLGQLAGQFVDDVLADAGEWESPENVDEAWLSFGFRLHPVHHHVVRPHHKLTRDDSHLRRALCGGSQKTCLAPRVGGALL